MSTIMVCGKCGGAVVGADSSHVGRRCSCANGGVATLADPSAVGVVHKTCCKCGKDVTHDRRMKDHLGEYWCYECGSADQLKKGQGVSMICPDCRKHVRPTHMLKHGEQYLCESCHAERQAHRGVFRARRARKGAGGGGKLILALLVLAAGAALIALYAMGTLP